ncbi:glycosyl transferase family 9 (plasmid) [Solidesulfovibrio carbinoliphilus subsp. oakridgensis]|uniref:Glycosyl transferase family 9 n=1 Tax=Solidesulfovibrio carbinoliphilus subsp. oakridgensis TaxID=694327 RepID=G7QE65_9BACT|nr:glycosyltransferase family 9 protein [Solidesulfovibrio carbinoliphilus]EHJ45959.1 glycosyl transferase family 9 [Solidesulfovibrio carbinoliphilus subsp. oakridgensis]
MSMNICIGLVEHLGDIVACEPVVRYLRQARPEARIFWCVRQAYADLVSHHPDLSGIIEVACPSEWRALVAAQAFDGVVSLHLAQRHCPLCKGQVGVQARFPTVTEVNYYFYGSLLEVFGACAGLPALRDQPRLHLPPACVPAVDALGLPPRYAVFHRQSLDEARNWDDAKWDVLARRLPEAFGLPVVEVGGPPAAGTPALGGEGHRDLRGRTSILETAEVIRRASLFVGIDSGPAHLGNALGTYGILLLGRFSVFRHHMPYTGVYATGENSRILRADGPARDISAEAVLEAVRQWDAAGKNGTLPRFPELAASVVAPGAAVPVRHPGVLAFLRREAADKITPDLLRDLAAVRLHHGDEPGFEALLAELEAGENPAAAGSAPADPRDVRLRQLARLAARDPGERAVAIRLVRELLDAGQTRPALAHLKPLLALLRTQAARQLGLVTRHLRQGTPACAAFHANAYLDYQSERSQAQLLEAAAQLAAGAASRADALVEAVLAQPFATPALLAEAGRLKAALGQAEAGAVLAAKAASVGDRPGELRRAFRDRLLASVAEGLAPAAEAPARGPGPKTAFFTICSANYIPTAMALFNSLMLHCQEGDLHLLLCEEPGLREQINLPPSIALHFPDKLGIPRWRQLAYYYNITEFNTAVKPYFFQKLFEQGYERVLYFDPDIRFYSSLSPLLAELDASDALLTPHMAKPYEDDGIFPRIEDCIRAGQFNLGFIGLAKGAQTEAFLRWWAGALYEKCLVETDYTYFVDQFFAAITPSFMDRVKVLRNAGYNMAYWNIFQRRLALEDGEYVTEDGPLVFFHFSGFDAAWPDRLSKYSDRGSPIAPGSALARLTGDYRAELEANAAFYPFGDIPYSFGRHTDGRSITGAERRAFLKLPRARRELLGNPFKLPAAGVGAGAAPGRDPAPRPQPPAQPRPAATTPRRLKVTKDYMAGDKAVTVGGQSEFARRLRETILACRPRKVIETGTFFGTGTTRAIADALLSLGTEFRFFTIECNPVHYAMAVKNLRQAGLLDAVRILQGLTVPRAVLPTVEEINRACVENVEFDDIFIDHAEHERALLYYQETDFKDAPDDLLGACLDTFDHRPDFVLLDSGGHMGNVEFNYLIERLAQPCILALDDILHIKHHRSFHQIRSDGRFEILASSQEKFGFCIARFTPAGWRAPAAPSGRRVRIAGQDAHGADLTEVGETSRFAQALEALIRREKPRRIVETGTYHGTGTTAAIARALLAADLGDAVFFTIECNPENHATAVKNLEAAGLLPTVRPLNGLSLPRTALPTRERIQRDCVERIEFDDIFVDHPENVRTSRYYAETDFDGPDDLLGQCLAAFELCPDLVLLDSGGHVGNVEFNYALSLIKSPCHIALDDIYHIKHRKSFAQMQADPRFEILSASDEKFGFAIARFTPWTTDDRPKRLLWVRTDAIGDSLLAAPLLPVLRSALGGPEVTVVCQEMVADCYRRLPAVAAVVGFDKGRLAADAPYREGLMASLREQGFDLALNTVYSRNWCSELFTVNSGAKKRIGFRGDDSNIAREDRIGAGRSYTLLVDSPAGHRLEVDRYRDFLTGLGLPGQDIRPQFAVSAGDREEADALLARHGLDPDKTVALFCGAQFAVRRYEGYGQAVAGICREMGLSVLALGGGGDAAINGRNLAAAGGGVDLSGQTTLAQAAALLSRCRLAVGAETGLAHLACAVGTPHVVLLGGGHFGRFMPYSPLTHVACLPLACYGCNWQCRYERAHCVADVHPGVMAEAVRAALAGPSDRIRVFMQAVSLWRPAGGRPAWKGPERYLAPGTCQLVPVVKSALAAG